jgi:hypothetical protein
VKVARQPKTLRILVVMIVCLTVVSGVACQFHPASSEHEHEKEMPTGHHQDGHSQGVSCLSARLTEELVLVEFTSVSWTAMPMRLHATLVVSPLFIPPRYSA